MYTFLRYSDTISPLLPAILLFWFGKSRFKEFLPILGLLLGCFILNGVANVLGDRQINNLWIYHLYAVLTLLFITSYFIRIIRYRHFKKAASVIFILFLGFTIVNILWWEDLQSFDSNGFGFNSIVIISYCVIFYYEKLQEPGITFIERLPAFWIVTGFFFYYTACMCLFMIFNGILNNKFTFSLFISSSTWTFHQVMFFIQNIFITIGILCTRLR